MWDIAFFASKIIGELLKYPAILSFFGAFIAGESIIVLLGILAGQRVMPFLTVFIFGVLGTCAADLCWFALGRKVPFYKMKKNRIIAGILRKSYSFTHILLKQSHERMLVMSKFAYGTRIATIIYLGHSRMRISKFITYNIILNIILVGFVLGLSWFTGRGIGDYDSVVDNLKIIGISFLVIIIAIIILERKVKKLVTALALKN